MNLRQPYEQLMADKLRQLHAPDADASWQQMKRLLDDDEDTRVGGRRRPPGNNGWWRIGILAIVLTAGFWLYIDHKPTAGTSLSKNNTAATPQADAKTGEASASKNLNKTQTTAIDNTTTPDNANNTTSAKNTAADKTGADKSTATAAAKNNAAIPDDKANASNNAGTTGNTPSAANGNKAPGKATVSLNNNIVVKNSGHKTKISLENKDDKKAGENVFAGSIAYTSKNGSKKTTGNTNGLYGTSDNAIADLSAGNGTALHNTSVPGMNGSRKIKPAAGKGTANNNADESKSGGSDINNNIEASENKRNYFAPANQIFSAKEKSWFERLTGLKINTPLPGYNTSLIDADSIAGNPELVLNNETKKAIAKAQRDKEIAVLDKKDKKFHLNLSNVFKPFSMRVDAEPWWAAGLALNSGVTLNAQNRYNYNVNAKSSIITDYIPSPYLQYHLNNYVYFQTELNFLTPQYTPQLLAYRQSSEVTAQSGMSQQKSIYIQKLYYFNWPVSLHYSPISNLYFSGGIQFSSFQSGLASIEEKQFATTMGPDHPSGSTTTVLKFKDDSIAAKIAPNEWRWQAGAEYYWNRFSVGLRYNQSFKNAINTTVSTALPPTVNRNQSLLFFVRYNLFESRDKK